MGLDAGVFNDGHLGVHQRCSATVRRSNPQETAAVGDLGASSYHRQVGSWVRFGSGAAVEPLRYGLSEGHTSIMTAALYMGWAFYQN